MTGHGYQFRAPWYVRERGGHGVRDGQALRPALQKYDTPEFSTRLIRDPRNSLAFTGEDLWGYPVPVAFPAPGKGRERFATSRIVTTGLRKLYQPHHDRFYAVVVELFCDEPGLPRAGAHRDLDVRFVMRRQRTVLTGGDRPAWRLARELMLDLLRHQHPGVASARVRPSESGDLADLWWADNAARARFAEEHRDLIDAVGASTASQAWLVGEGSGAGRWADPADRRGDEREQEFPMWRLPDRPGACAAANTRSLWFGLVPTYSADHWIDPDTTGKVRAVPKLDERAIYELVCLVSEPATGRCPPPVYRSVPTEPFRLAAPYDPDGTKNHATSIQAPDLRALAARAGRPAGPGGLAITSPPGSGLSFNPFAGVPKPGSGSLNGGGVCTFAFELFFIVAFFLFLMFLPIVVFAFQLWWMLALRFCFPRLTLQLQALATFFAVAHVDAVADIQLAANADARLALDAVVGVQVPRGSGQPGVAASLAASPGFHAHPELLSDLVAAVDPAGVPEPVPPPVETSPPDPLCAGP
ncbi:hypothetical protein R8Z50_13005 [Longispora sp. K20-0274]|uniref:hypothetical protein n=1 Tax=Longispora sp. K20-0274 TaxID=3088255 RepID=UPI00399BBA74